MPGAAAEEEAELAVGVNGDEDDEDEDADDDADVDVDEFEDALGAMAGAGVGATGGDALLSAAGPGAKAGVFEAGAGEKADCPGTGASFLSGVSDCVSAFNSTPGISAVSLVAFVSGFLASCSPDFFSSSGTNCVGAMNEPGGVGRAL